MTEFYVHNGMDVYSAEAHEVDYAIAMHLPSSIRDIRNHILEKYGVLVESGMSMIEHLVVLASLEKN